MATLGQRGVVANIDIHGVKADLHLELLWNSKYCYHDQAGVTADAAQDVPVPSH